MAFSLRLTPTPAVIKPQSLSIRSVPAHPLLSMPSSSLAPAPTVRLAIRATASKQATAAVPMKPAATVDPRKPDAASEPRKLRPVVKSRRVTRAMRAFLGGVAEIPRIEALLRVWAYIRKNRRQDRFDKKMINCDKKLQKIFAGKGRVDVREVPRLVSQHFIPEE